MPSIQELLQQIEEDIFLNNSPRNYRAAIKKLDAITDKTVKYADETDQYAYVFALRGKLKGKLQQFPAGIKDFEQAISYNAKDTQRYFSSMVFY